MGIPVLRTTGVSASSTTVSYTVNKFLSSYCFYFRRILVMVNKKKLSVAEDKTIMTDSNIGLTIATDKTQIIDMVRKSYNDCKIKKESVVKYDEEMRRCEDILKILNSNSDITTNVTKDFKEFDELKAEVKEIKDLLQKLKAVSPEEDPHKNED